MRNFTIYADGGCHCNGGENPRAYGSYAKLAENGRMEVVRLNFDEAKTNNQAEYQALLAVLDALQTLIAKGIEAKATVHTDSAIVVNQVSGKWKVKDAALRQLHNNAVQAIRRLADHGVSVSLCHVPRAVVYGVLGH